MTAKRSHGAGSISKRGENSWRLRYYVGDVRQAVTFRGTKKEAETELRRLLGDVDKGTHIAPAKLTLKQWADQWVELKAAERQHKTVARYEDLLRLHVMPKLGDRLLQKITAHEVNLLYAQMTTLAPRTRHHVATVLKSCLQAAVESKLIPSNPAGKKPSPGDAEIGQALEQDQISALVGGLPGLHVIRVGLRDGVHRHAPRRSARITMVRF
jgi:integrase